ncbi:unnamed protein product [Leptosia nina]|uniref:Citrate transporter-like domain-containing protein n=1 Tax=Leptosia nina TaxID=320188 RepID=A0AAV1JAY3_9NEOP
MDKLVKRVKEWKGVSRNQDQELSRSQYSLVSTGELTAEALQVWLKLPKKIKYDPDLEPFQKKYENEIAKSDSIPLEQQNGNRETKRLPSVKSAPHLNNNREEKEKCPDAVEIHPQKDNCLGEKSSERQSKIQCARHYIKMSFLLACWVFFTLVFLMYNEKEHIVRNSNLNPGEIKTYSLNVSKTDLAVFLRLKGPFVSEQTKNKMNASEFDATQKMTVWLEQLSTGLISEQWPIPLQEADFDFIAGETRSSVLKLSAKNASDMALRMKTTSNQSAPFSITYTIDPIDPTTGVIYACALLCGLYVLIIFEVVNRTMAAVIIATTALGVISMLGERPSLPELISWLDVETLLLLFSMMILVAIMAETGMFDFLAVYTFEVTKGKLWPLITVLCAITAFLSTFLDNVTTVLLMTPVTIRLCEVMDMDPVPILMSMVLFSNIGGTATPVGDPPNVIIASNKAVVQAGINFTNFTMHMTLGIVLVCVQTYFQLRFIYRDTNKLRLNVPRDIQDLRHQISIWRRAIESLPHLSKDTHVVRERLEKKMRKLTARLEVMVKESSKRVCPKDTFHTTLMQLKDKYKIRDKLLLLKSTIAISFVVVVFFLHSIPELNRVSLGWTALLGAILLLTLADREDLEPILHRVEWSTLLFFAALFILMEALTKLGLIEFIGGLTEALILKVDESARLAVALILLLWVSGVSSAFVDNIPLTTMMVRVVTALGSNPALNLPIQPLIWALSFGACLGGNGTLIGASANVVCAGVAEQHGYRFTFMQFFKVGFPVMIGHLVVATAYLLLFSFWFSRRLYTYVQAHLLLNNTSNSDIAKCLTMDNLWCHKKSQNRELNRSTYSLVSCGDVTADTLQSWNELPEEIKKDPSLDQIRQKCEELGGDLNQTLNGSRKAKSTINSDPIIEDLSPKSGVEEFILDDVTCSDRETNDSPSNRKNKAQSKRTWHYIKMTLLLGCWVFFTGVFLTHNEKHEVFKTTAVLPDQINNYSLITRNADSISVKLIGPFLTSQMERNLNVTDYEARERMVVWLEGSTEVSSPWNLTLSNNLNYNEGETRSHIFRLNSTDYILRLRTTASTVTAFKLSYSLNPLDAATGVIYAVLLLCGLYVLIIFEIINRTMAALLVSTTSLAALALVGDRPTLPELISWLDVETLLLLFSMMILVAIMAETGIFDFLAVFTFEVTKGRLWPLIFLLCIITAVLSTFLDNVTTVLLMSPVTIRLCEVMELDPVPILMFMAIYSNIGGTATPVGDPPNVIVASNKAVIQAGINFTNFTAHMSLGVVFILVHTTLQIKYIMYRDVNKLRVKVPREIQELRHQISIWRRAADSLPHLSNGVNIVRERLERKIIKLNKQLNAMVKERNKRACPKDTFKSTLEELKGKYKIRDKGLLVKSTVAIVFVVTVFFLHSIPELNRVSLAMTALLGAILLLTLADRSDIEPILHRVEWSTLLFFAALFVLMEALSKLGLILYVGGLMELLILQVDESYRLAVALMLIIWVSGTISAFVDNIPLTTMMVRVVVSIGTNPKLNLPMAPLIWALLYGACLGGNGTLIGASANVVCAGVAEQHGYKFTFVKFFKVGFPIMIGHLVVCSLYLLVCHCVFEWH